jgi:hypothetical protein
MSANERQRGANEAIFREINEAIERAHPSAAADRNAAFRCECSDPGCADLVSLAPSRYERIRSHPRRFLLRPGHEDQAIERVVERGPGYVVVEKVGEAGREAHARDPRS